MKSLRTWMAGLLMLIAAWTTHGAAPRADRIQLQGRDYVRITEWSKSYGFTNQWLIPDRELQVSTRWSKVVFTIDSKMVLINGVNLWLAAPVAGVNETAYVSAVDLEKNIHPVIFPPRNEKGEKITTICLDPGHGGKDPGNQEGKRQEKEYVLKLAQELRSQLLKAGFKVTMTRNSDIFVPLEDRPELAHRREADLFVSLHFNGVPNARTVARGVETYCLTPARTSSTNAGGEGGHTGSMTGNDQDEFNLYLAFLVQRSLIRNLDVEDRGVRRARFAVLKSAQMPAVLIEGGFLSDPEEGRKLAEPGYRRKMAQSIVDAIQTYKKAVER